MGEAESAHVRGPPRLLPAARREGARLTVYLVGAGPGDPGLITARGLELVRSCDVLVHDRLLAPELVDEAPADALVVSRDGLAQREIERLLIAHARDGRTVVRLKGGDPFVFGRGGEEGLALAAARVPFEVVPGVSSLAAVPAAAGIPITHRGLASQVTLVSGHAELDYACLARAPGTLVVYMGLGRLCALVDGLLAHGKPLDTPAAVIASGTLEAQREVIAPLSELPAAAADFEPPALVVIGDVVALAHALRPARALVQTASAT